MESKRVLFYTHSPRMFRSTLIGHLFLISQDWPVVLISEKLDQETENLLKNKDFFPKLERIVSINQFGSDNKMGLFAKNRYLYRMAKQLIEEEKYDLVISASDMHSMFEMYLMRFSKKNKSLNVCFQTAVDADDKIGQKWIDYTNVYIRFPNFLHFSFRIFLVKIRRNLGHFLYYWILPLSVGQKPFTGRASYILRTGNSGMRDSNYQVVFSERDFKIYKNAGVSEKKLKILPHPLLINKSRDFLREIYLREIREEPKVKKTIVILMPASKIGFNINDWSLIPKEERVNKWLNVIKIVSDNLPNWQIIIKPHPDFDDIDKIKIETDKISNSIIIINPKESVDKYVELADAIMDLPRSASTVVFTASMQCPGKPIAVLDFHNEVLGDFYKDFQGSSYINNDKDLVSFLKRVDTIIIEKGQTYVKISDYGTMDLLKDLLK
jgi:hypothetical protein